MKVQLEIPSVRSGFKMKIFKSNLPMDDAMRLIEERGGKMIIAKIRIPSWGWLAFYNDPDGNCHGLITQSNDSFQFN
jgi:predicted enzyme related to lactoylglutathione lyase